MTRYELRNRTAKYLNGLSRDECFDRFAITRTGNLTGLDSIGIPVYSVARPVAKIVSVNAGKGMDLQLARAGAIAEGIEFSVFENPDTDYARGRVADLGFPLAKGSQWDSGMPIALERAIHLSSGQEVDFPFSLIWLTRPLDEPPYFQKSSNGQACGGSLADALLQAIYECVERDQYVLRRISLSELGLWPPRMRFCHPAVEAVQQAGFSFYLFNCSADIPIPAYWAIIIDPAWRHCGGWGAHLNPWVAAERAVLEAIQSRAVVISGARDDLDRRDPDWVKGMACKKELDALPIAGNVPNVPVELSAEVELEIVLRLLDAWKEKIYFKHISLEPLHLVKVQILGMEQPVMRHWQSVRWHKLRERYLSDQVSTG